MTCKPGRWKSRSVDLRVLGTAGSLVTLLAGCSGGSNQRNVYNSEADCGLDYALSVCTTRGYARGGQFFGPVYRVVKGVPQSCNSQDPGPGSLPTHRVSIEPVRGGLGCSRRSSWRSGSGSSNSGYRWSSGG